MRIRSIKPEFFKDDELAELPAMTRLLFIGLWCMADGEGRLENRPRRIKAEIFAYDDCDVEAALQSLADHGFVTMYAVGDDAYIQIANFKKHQRITGKEAETKSTIPSPDVSVETQSGNIGETVNVQEGKGREGSRKGEGEETRTPSDSPNLPPPPEGKDPEASSQRLELLEYLRGRGCTLKMRGEDIFAEWVNAGFGYPVKWIKIVCNEAKRPPALPSDLRKLLKARMDEYAHWRRPNADRRSESLETPANGIGVVDRAVN
jgi:hypothetical protein